MTDVKTIAAAWKVDRVTSLRQAMSSMGFDALVVPRWDEQQFEYVYRIPAQCYRLSQGTVYSSGAVISLELRGPCRPDHEYHESLSERVRASPVRV